MRPRNIQDYYMVDWSDPYYYQGMILPRNDSVESDDVREGTSARLERNNTDQPDSEEVVRRSSSPPPAPLDIWVGDDQADSNLAQLAKDFDLMVGTGDLKTEHKQQSGTSPCFCVSGDTWAPKLESMCLALSIGTFVVALLLGIQTLTAQQFGSAILCLVGSLVFLFLIFLQKKGLQHGTAIASFIASLSVGAVFIVVLTIWARDMFLLLSSEPHDAKNSNSLVGQVEAKLFPSPKPQLWGCFPRQENIAADARPVRINDLSMGCIISETCLGLLSIVAAISAAGVAVLSSWVVIRMYREQNKASRAAQTGIVYPTTLFISS